MGPCGLMEKGVEMNINQQPPGISHIAQVAINVSDLDRAVSFYRDTLGLKHLFSVPPKMSFFQCGEVRIMLATPEKPEYDHQASILYYEVADIGRSHETLVSRGVRFEQVPVKIASLDQHDLWLAFFRDSEGNPLALMSHVPRTS